MSELKGKISGGGSVRGSLLTIPRIVNDLTTGGTSMALSAEMGKELNKKASIYIGDNEPDSERVLWFNTNRAAAGAATLLLNENEDGFAVQAEIEGAEYGVENATINATPTSSGYDFTIL